MGVSGNKRAIGMELGDWRFHSVQLILSRANKSWQKNEQFKHTPNTIFKMFSKPDSSGYQVMRVSWQNNAEFTSVGYKKNEKQFDSFQKRSPF